MNSQQPFESYVGGRDCVRPIGQNGPRKGALSAYFPKFRREFPKGFKYFMDSKEAAFVQRLQARERQAYEELYDRYASAIYGVGLRMLRAEDLAEDAMQETFVRVWKKIYTYDPSKGRLFTWMLNIVRNYCKDVLKSSARKMSAQTDSGHQSVEDHMGHSEEMPVETIGLVEVLDQLPENQKAVITRIYLKGMTHVETAEELGMPLGTVKSNVRLGMKRLRALIL